MWRYYLPGVVALFLSSILWIVIGDGTPFWIVLILCLWLLFDTRYDVTPKHIREKITKIREADHQHLLDRFREEFSPLLTSTQDLLTMLKEETRERSALGVSAVPKEITELEDQLKALSVKYKEIMRTRPEDYFGYEQWLARTGKELT